MFDLLVSSMLASDQFRALVESNIDEQDQDNWNTITHPETGELAKELKLQRSFLVNIFYFSIWKVENIFSLI